MSARTQNLDPSNTFYSWFVPELSSQPNFTLTIKLSDTEREKLASVAKQKGLTMAELVREWVDRLPNLDR